MTYTDIASEIHAINCMLDNYQLTGRLRYIAKQLIIGYTQAEIARKLKVSQPTIGYYVKKLREIMDPDNQHLGQV